VQQDRHNRQLKMGMSGTMRPVAEWRDVASDYDAFAAIYSRWIGREFAERAWPVIERLVAASLEPGATVLDLCCGCGHIARRLSEAGYRVTGLDASGEMLRIARENARGAMFVQGDARNFCLGRRFATVVSTFNSFAHMDTAELVDVFRCVREALREDGVFLFDLTMEEAYLARWRGEFSSIAEDHACVVRPTYDAEVKVATNYVTAFERDSESRASESNGSDAWRRSDFTIVQKCHARAAVEELLGRAGFAHVQMMDAQHDLGMAGESGRAFFLCK
jgi:SAM-dependent methyltransferase